MIFKLFLINTYKHFYLKINIIIAFAILNILNSQSILPANPNYLISYEYNNYLYNNNHYLTLFRPQLDNSVEKLFINISNQSFYNDNAPNFENRDNIIIGKGLGGFLGLKLSLFKNYFVFSIEPYYYMNRNKKFDIIIRDGHFSLLNDKSYNNNKPIRELGVREAHFYFMLNEYDIGFRNANMWWGPGVHSSLTMTNNTEGFPYLLIGTL